MAWNIERLPHEVLVQIMLRAPDLLWLYNLIMASPAAYRVFSDRAYETFMTILIHSADLPRQLQGTIEMLAHVRSDFKFFPDMGQLRSIIELRYSADLAKHPLGITTFSNYPVHLIPGPDDAKGRRFHDIFAHRTTLPPKLPASIFRSLLADAACIQRLAGLCLGVFRDRLRSIHFEGSPDLMHVQNHSPGVDMPFSWEETYRLVRVGWRLQLLRDLQAKAWKGLFDRLNWPAHHIQALKAGRLRAIFRVEEPTNNLQVFSPYEWRHREYHSFVEWLGEPMTMGWTALPKLRRILAAKEEELSSGPANNSQTQIQPLTISRDVNKLSENLFRHLGLALWDVDRVRQLGFTKLIDDDPNNDEMGFFEMREEYNPVDQEKHEKNRELIESVAQFLAQQP